MPIPEPRREVFARVGFLPFAISAFLGLQTVLRPAPPHAVRALLAAGALLLLLSAIFDAVRPRFRLVGETLWYRVPFGLAPWRHVHLAQVLAVGRPSRSLVELRCRTNTGSKRVRLPVERVSRGALWELLAELQAAPFD